jgi:hypothetical protein
MKKSKMASKPITKTKMNDAGSVSIYNAMKMNKRAFNKVDK